MTQELQCLTFSTDVSLCLAGLVFTDVAEFARTIHVKEEPGAAGGGAPEGAAAAPVKQEGGGGGAEEEENYGLGDEAMETDEPGANSIKQQETQS